MSDTTPHDQPDEHPDTPLLDDDDFQLLLGSDAMSAFAQQRSAYASTLRQQYLSRLKSGEITFDDLCEIVKDDEPEIRPLKTLRMGSIVAAVLGLPTHRANKLCWRNGIDAKAYLGSVIMSRDMFISAQALMLGHLQLEHQEDITSIPKQYPWNGNLMTILMELGRDKWPPELQRYISREKMESTVRSEKIHHKRREEEYLASVAQQDIIDNERSRN